MFEVVNQHITRHNKINNDKKVYIETYGCQMNIADSEIVLSVLSKFGYNSVDNLEQSDLILINTCSIREHAEERIHQRLNNLKVFKRKNPTLIIGILGCMAERMRKEILAKHQIVDLIVGPDEYRKLPQLIENFVETGEKGIAVKLSRVETYDDITPVRKDGVTAFVSVMRGCDKFCTFCVVPFTRGRERSRKLESIVDEVKYLYDEGIREVTLLGQNVNSYNDGGRDFAMLLRKVAIAVPAMRIRYTTSHPYDLSDRLLETMAEFNNICKYIHLPIQSGSDRILRLMNRLYTVKGYMERLNKARQLMPSIGLSTDIIVGFPTETEADHKMTVDLMKEVQYDGAFMFAYSPRENTKAANMPDAVPVDIKKCRLEEIIEIQREISYHRNRNMIGTVQEILLESTSKKSPDFLMGRTDCNKSVIVAKGVYKIGDLRKVKIFKVNSATLFGEIVTDA
ncbi:MAG: tRNA (N6-isopentenyl adenosine(37)-C2)-methylthiotransferase MiaB [Ignavibacteria bacterium]